MQHDFQTLVKTEVAPIGELLQKRHLPPIEIAEHDGGADDERETGMTSPSAARCWASRGTDCAVAVEADRLR